MSNHCMNGSQKAHTFVTTDTAMALSLLVLSAPAPEPSLLRNLEPLVASEPHACDSRSIMLFNARQGPSSGAVDCPAVMVPKLCAAVPSTADTSLSVHWRCAAEHPCIHTVLPLSFSTLYN